MLDPKVILAPIDFSPPSLDAAETAADLAARYGAVLLLVHVVPALPDLPPNLSIFKEGDYERQLQADGARKVEELSLKLGQGRIKVQSKVGVANDVGMEVVRIARDNSVGLIVIATHGMTGWNAFVFGSVAEKVMRLAPCAVLVQKPPAAKG